MLEELAQIVESMDERSRWIDAVIGAAAADPGGQLDQLIGVASEYLGGRGGSYLFDLQLDVRLAGVRCERAVLLLERYLRDDRLEDLAVAVEDMTMVFERHRTTALVDLGPSRLALYHWVRGRTLAEVFDHSGDRQALTQANEDFEAALRLRPAEPAYIASLAFARRSRFDRPEHLDVDHGDGGDLDDAIDWLQDAVDLLPVDDPNRGPWLSSVSAMCLRRYDHWDERDLYRAETAATEALASVVSDADGVAALRAQAAALRQLYDLHRIDRDCEEAIDSLDRAIEIGRQAPSRFGLCAACDASEWALARGDHHDAVSAGLAGLEILRAMSDRQIAPSQAEPWLRLGVRLASDTAWAMISIGDIVGAALTLEHSRTTVMSALVPDRRGDRVTEPELRAIATVLPLCYLAMSTQRAFALIVDSAGFRAVTFDRVDLADVAVEVRRHWRDVVQGRGGQHAQRSRRNVGPPAGSPVASPPPRTRRDAIDHLVGWLEDAVMSTLARELDAPAAVLIATGAFAGLPLHAGSICNGGGLHWTFAPSARALRAARSRAIDGRGDVLLAVADPAHVRTPPLPGATLEITEIASLYPDKRVLLGADACVDNVLDAVAHSNVIHFACHGHGDVRDPMSSELLLAGTGRLVLRDLIGDISFDSVRLAVLSACETNVTSWTLPDEAVSFATGLLFAGAAGVIGSLWKVPDEATRHLMVDFHRRWRGGDTSPADALLAAQHAMRRGDLGDGAFTHPEDWAAFVYIGA